MNSSQALVGFDRPLTPANANDADLAQRCAELEAGLRAGAGRRGRRAGGHVVPAPTRPASSTPCAC